MCIEGCMSDTNLYKKIMKENITARIFFETSIIVNPPVFNGTLNITKAKLNIYKIRTNSHASGASVSASNWDDRQGFASLSDLKQPQRLSSGFNGWGDGGKRQLFEKPESREGQPFLGNPSLPRHSLRWQWQDTRVVENGISCPCTLLSSRFHCVQVCPRCCHGATTEQENKGANHLAFVRVSATINLY